MPRFPGLPVGPRCPAIPGSPFGPISPWKEKREARQELGHVEQAHLCGSTQSLAMRTVLLVHAKSFQSGLLWETGKVMRSCEREIDFSRTREERRSLPWRGIYCLRDTAARHHTCWCPKPPPRMATVGRSCVSVTSVPVTLQAAREHALSFS